jgi:ADP-heptose:LPS heptosyltransferase
VGKSREFIRTLESLWRHRVVYPGLRRILKNTELHGRVDIHSTRSILILRHDRIGDMIVTTPIFRNLKKANPGLVVGVFASEKNAEIIRHNPYVDIIYVAYSNWIALAREVMRARSQRYDVVLNFIFNRMTTSGLLANIIAPKGIKVGQGIEKYRFYFNRLLSLERYEHPMTELLSSFVHNVFGDCRGKNNSGYEIFIDKRSKAGVDRFLRSHRLKRRTQSGKAGNPYLVFNLSAPEICRRLSTEQILALENYIGSQSAFRTVVITAPMDDAMDRLAAHLCREMNCIRFPEAGHAPLLQIASLIEGAFCVLTPHTSIIHFASAVKTPVLGFYDGSAQTNEWMPFKVKHLIVRSNMNCHVSTIPMPQLLRSTRKFLKELRP